LGGEQEAKQRRTMIHHLPETLQSTQD